MMLAWNFSWFLFVGDNRFFLLFRLLWPIRTFSLDLRTLFVINLNRSWFFQFFVLFNLTKLRLKSYGALTLFEKHSKIDLLEEFSLNLKWSININFILFIVLDKLFLSEIQLLILATKRIKLISRNREVINHSIILKLQLIIVPPKLFNETVN